MSKRFLITITTLLVIAVVAGAAVFFARGYRLSTSEKRIVGTGIINISSEPDAASVFVDGHLTTATNATISSLTPKTYSVKVQKEGFIPWEKSVAVREGLVTGLKVTLFPAIPSVYPLTVNSIANPTLSPDGSKLAFVIPSRPVGGGVNKKAGVWVWTMVKNQPISFIRSSEPHQIGINTITDFSKATLKFSPDSKQVLATVDNNNFLLNSDGLNNDPRDITAILSATLNSWEDDTKTRDAIRIGTIKNISLKKIASDSARLDSAKRARLASDPTLSRFAKGDGSERAFLRWSPDETKFMVRKADITDRQNDLTPDVKVYDLEDGKEYSLPGARAFVWLPDSRHIILVDENTISLVDFDGTNKAVIYAGKFEDSFVFPWPDSSRLVMVSSFPTPTASEPNLYGINLR